MPSRNRTTVSDVPVYALMSMISDPEKYGKLMEQFSIAETAAKNAESVARDRENAAGHREIAVSEREEALAGREERLKDLQAAFNNAVDATLTDLVERP